MKTLVDAARIDSARAYRSESDIAVLTYIESLLLESVAGEAVPADLLASSSPATEPAFAATNPGASVVESVNRRATQLQAPEDLPDAANSAADTKLGESQSTAVSAASNPFLRQLEAAQRKGLGRFVDGVVDSSVDSIVDSAAFNDDGSETINIASATRVDNRPVWGRANFSCLSFKVAGLTLAIPVQFIEGMQPLDLATSVCDSVESADSANPAGQMMLGKMKLDRFDQEPELCDVIDTARLVMPERYDAAMTQSYRYILSIKNCDWCVAVEAIGGELALSSQNVRWRSEHTRREWLAGTVVDKMCALIDVDVLNRQIMADRVLLGAD